MGGRRALRKAMRRTAAMGVALASCGSFLPPLDAAHHGIEVAAATARAEQDFVNADIDLDGALSVEEFAGIVPRHLGDMSGGAHSGGLLRRVADRIGVSRGDPRKAQRGALDPEQLHALRKRLLSIDADGDGAVSLDEYLATTPDYAAMDRNADGWITDAELRIWQRQPNRERRRPSEIQIIPPPPR